MAGVTKVQLLHSLFFFIKNLKESKLSVIEERERIYRYTPINIATSCHVGIGSVSGSSSDEL